MKYGHLEKIELILETLSPVHIGSGEELTKKEYIFDKANGLIYMPDLARLADFLFQRSLLDAYEDYLIHPFRNNLCAFLTENGIEKKDYPSFVSYTIDAGEAASSEHFRGVLTFMKGADGLPYIPGSSLKGAIRTAIAAKLLEKGNYEKNISDIERSADDFRNPHKYISRESDDLERRIFCKLEIKDPKNPNRIRWDNIVNSFMKGISVSDSGPVGCDRLTLCGKYDMKPDGTVKQPPIYRECLVPGTKAGFALTLDKTILDKAGIDADYIKRALNDFSRAQFDHFGRYFPNLPDSIAHERTDGIGIILGGGTGFASKTVVYPLIHERDRALKLVSKIMTKQFRKHKHEKDMGYYRVSPHTFKAVKYKGQYYQMGKCRLEFM